MKHALETDASSTYDRGFHEKVQQGAFDFCTRFATEFEATYTKDPSVTVVTAPSVGTAEYTGKHMDECMVCGDGGVLSMCTYCKNTVHMACAGSQPVNIDLDERYCSACNARFGDQVEPVTAAATVARTSAVGAAEVALVAAAVVGAQTPCHGESGQSAPSIPSGLGDGDDDVAKGDIVVIKTDGENRESKEMGIKGCCRNPGPKFGKSVRMLSRVC